LAEFKNPTQQGGGDNKSLLVMMLVMVTVFFGLQYYKSRKNPQTASPNPAVTQSAPPSAAAPPVAVMGLPAGAPAPATAAATAAVKATAETTTVVENELYKISFTNRGGQVSQWLLKKYKDSEGKPLDLVHQMAAQKLTALAQAKMLTPPMGPDDAHQGMVASMANVEGRVFDKAYLDAQVADHQAALALFDSEARNGADPDIKAFAAQSLPMMRQHLAMAQRLDPKR